MDLLDVFPTRPNCDVMYNVEPRDVPSHKYPLDPMWEYVNRIPRPSPIGPQEYEAVANAVLDCWHAEVHESACPPWDEIHEQTAPFIPRIQGDRSVPIFSPSLIYVNPSLVRRLQGVLHQFSSWRVLIYDDDPNEFIAVYPDAAHFGVEDRGLPIEAGLAAWSVGAMKRRTTAKFLLLRRRFRFLEPLVPQAVSRLPPCGVSVLAIYDHLGGDMTRHSAWVVQRDSPTRRVVEERGDELNSGLSREYPILDGKTVGAKNMESPEGLYLVEWNLPARDGHELSIVLQNANGVPTTTWLVAVPREDVVHEDGRLESQRV